MFRIESRGGAIVWRQGDIPSAPPPAPTGSYAPRGKWTAGGRGSRARAYSHVSEGASSGTNSLTANDLTTGQPTLDSPVIGQNHALAATGITTGQPTLDSPVLNGTAGSVSLVANSISTGAPTLGAPTLGQIHILVASGITTGAPTVGIAPTSVPAVVLGSLVGTVQTGYPRRPSNRQLGRRY